MQLRHGYRDLVGFGRRSIDTSLVRLTRFHIAMTGAPQAAIDDRTVGYFGRALWPTACGQGVVRGAIQVPPGGEPVIFMADHPVTGGYPVVAVLVDDDADRAAQSAPGQQIRIVLAE